jgi:hypothetical protein
MLMMPARPQSLQRHCCNSRLTKGSECSSSLSPRCAFKIQKMYLSAHLGLPTYVSSLICRGQQTGFRGPCINEDKIRSGRP